MHVVTQHTRTGTDAKTLGWPEKVENEQINICTRRHHWLVLPLLIQKYLNFFLNFNIELRRTQTCYFAVKSRKRLDTGVILYFDSHSGLAVDDVTESAGHKMAAHSDFQTWTLEKKKENKKKGEKKEEKKKKKKKRKKTTTTTKTRSPTGQIHKTWSICANASHEARPIIPAY